MSKEADNVVQAAVDLLASGDDTGCDGLVCVANAEYAKLREVVHELTGEWHGVDVGDDDDQA